MTVRITTKDLARDTGSTNRMDMAIIVTSVTIILAGALLLLI